MIYTIYWIVDGCTGNTQLRCNNIQEAYDYWNLMFKPYGYKLREISLSY